LYPYPLPLATNALVEGKFRAGRVVFVGYDKELISKFGLNENFGTPHVYYFRGGHDLNGKPQAEPEWELIVKQAEQLASEVEAFAVSGYYSILNAEHEKQACELISQAVAQPIICGHQLSTRLDSVKRATTAVLNASLISINQQFIRLSRALQQRGIQAPLW
jgi:N-methylhydantoinase A/oxoprolinase/acetone carboxylase beta subunit